MLESSPRFSTGYISFCPLGNCRYLICEYQYFPQVLPVVQIGKPTRQYGFLAGGHMLIQAEDCYKPTPEQIAISAVKLGNCDVGDD
jgi:hypothetical protein